MNVVSYIKKVMLRLMMTRTNYQGLKPGDKGYQITDPRDNPDTPRDILLEVQTLDIFNHLPDFSNKRVFIVGSGPNGAKYLEKLMWKGKVPPYSVLIALNSMINYDLPWEWWMAMDHRLVDLPWWKTPRIPAECYVLFGARLINRMYLDAAKRTLVDPNYFFKYYPHITGASFLRSDEQKVTPIFFEGVETDPRILLKDGYLRGGLTIAGCALQFAYYAGAKQTILCGIDFEGQDHIDGHKNIDAKYKGKWPWLNNMQKFCGWLRSPGLNKRVMAVEKMSPSKLEIPVWGGF